YYMDAGYTIPLTASNYTTEPIYCNFNADGYRLPTEGEWEHFARAGTSGPFSCDEPDYKSTNCGSCTSGTHPTLAQYCVYCANNPGETAVVGSKLPNLWNLKDVHGNVLEFCWDWIANYPTGTVTDYVGPDSSHGHVIRGGGWDRDPRLCRSANRGWSPPSDTCCDFGFRLVRTVSF
ncbi:MAG: formylglycine-generating enzyme family protein, partial [bacterium]